MACDFAQCDFTPSGPGTWSGNVTIGGTAFPATLDLSSGTVTDWTITVNAQTVHADASSTLSPLHALFLGIAFDCGSVDLAVVENSCGSAGPPSGHCTFCPDLPATLFVTATGFINGTCGDCTPFNGTFACTIDPDGNCFWVSDVINACGDTWRWGVHGTPTEWQVLLINTGGTKQWVYTLVTPTCVLPLTLPGPTFPAADCTGPPSIVLSA